MIEVSTSSKIIYGEDGSPVGIEGVLRDITERKRTEHALLTSEEKFSKAFHNNPIPIYITTIPDGVFIDVNPMVEKISGFKRNEIIGKTSLELGFYEKPEERDDLFQQLRKNGKLYDYEISFRIKSGKSRLCRVFSEIIEIQGKPHLLSMILDVTERRQAEEKLKESEKSLRELTAHLQSAREQERTSIARELHDELGQVLTALNMDVSWLQKQLGQDQKNLRKKTQTMSSLLTDTIKVVQRISSELRPGQLDDLGLQAALEWYTGEFEARTGIKCPIEIKYLEEDIDKEISTCIFRILQESLTNVARHSKASHVEVQLNEKDNTIELVVKDNGIGISEKQLLSSKSFGLIGMKERSEFLGGDVRIERNKQKGTTVSVHIPL